MRLLRVPEPLTNPDMTWEIKLDGFRALAFIEKGRCTFVSRNGHTFKSWPSLCEQLVKAVRCRNAILDGEIVCLDADGQANFRNLLFRRVPPHFVAFDLIACEGEDLTQLPLFERKARLRMIVRGSGSVMGLDGMRGRGQDLFREICGRDMEGIVGKHVGGSYCTDGRLTSWVKVKNPSYSQMEGRAELFEQRAPMSRGCSLRLRASASVLSTLSAWRTG